MSDHNENPEIRPDVTEAIKLSFESMKQLTTLNAGSVLLIGTFLKDIFPSKHGTLAIGPNIKLLIAMSFLCFGLSLGFAAYEMAFYSRSLSKYQVYLSGGPAPTITPEIRWHSYTRKVPMPLFTVGLACFGLAVLLNFYR